MLSIGPPVASLANPEMVAISLPISQYKGLGFVNFIQGFTFPCGELQSRYLLKVFKGEVATPSLEEQFVDMEENRNAVCAQFIDRSQLRVLNGNFMQYYQDLAYEIGCYPTLWKLLTQVIPPVPSSFTLFRPYLDTPGA